MCTSVLNTPTITQWSTCKMEEGGVSSLLIATVDVLWSEEFLDSVEVSLLGSIQESRVPSQEVGEVTLLFLHQVQRCEVVPVPTVNICSMLHRLREG